MEKIFAALEELKNINKAYGLSTESIEKLSQEISSSKVCIPVIGKFSSGKSALVNTLLGYSKKMLKENITPETAIPAEIMYTDSEDSVVLIKNDGSCESISTGDYRSYEADATTVKCARIQLRNSFLKEIPDVMIVDMPGFESGFEVHNKAIDNYLPQSLAYIITFPADDMIVRSSIGNILKELCLHDMPLCVVITKYDKRNDDFDVSFANLQDNLKRFVGNREIVFCRTSSFTGDAEEMEEFLKDIQEKSQEILSRSFTNSVLTIADNTESYLKTMLSNGQLSASELDEEEEKLKKQLFALDSRFSEEQKEFNYEISEVIDEIKNDVRCAMEAQEPTLVAMIMNRQEIQEHLNITVRNAVTVSVKKRLIPRMEKYIKRVANHINSDKIGDIRIIFHFDIDKLNEKMTNTVVTAVAGILCMFAGILSGPLMMFVLRKQEEQKREETKQQIRRKLRSDVIPQVLDEVGNRIEMVIAEQVQSVNMSIEEKIQSQRNTLEKAMADIRGKMNDEKSRKENQTIDIKSDLEKIGEIKNGL